MIKPGGYLSRLSWITTLLEPLKNPAILIFNFNHNGATMGRIRDGRNFGAAYAATSTYGTQRLTVDRQGSWFCYPPDRRAHQEYSHA